MQERPRVADPGGQQRIKVQRSDGVDEARETRRIGAVEELERVGTRSEWRLRPREVGVDLEPHRGLRTEDVEEAGAISCLALGEGVVVRDERQGKQV